MNWTGKFSSFDLSRTVVTIKKLSYCLDLIVLFLREESNIRIKVLVQKEQAGIPRSICNSEFWLSVTATKAAVLHNSEPFQSNSKYSIILVPNFMFWRAHFRGVDGYSKQLLTLYLFPLLFQYHIFHWEASCYYHVYILRKIFHVVVNFKCVA